MFSTQELTIRFLVGGFAIVMITAIAKTKYAILSGIAMLFPVMSLIGLYFISQSVSVQQLQQITKVSLYSLSTTFTFIVSFYYLQDKFSVNTALLLSVISWGVSALIMILVLKKI